MKRHELIQEHERLIRTLRIGSKKERDKEAARQQNELKTMRGPTMKKVDKFLKTLTDAEREYLAGLLEAKEETEEGEEEDEKEEVMEDDKKPSYLK